MTLAPDVVAAIEDFRREHQAGISEAVNALVRQALVKPGPAHRFVQEQYDLGPAMVAIDDIAGLLDSLEGDDRRS